MADSSEPDSPIEAAAGAAGTHTTEAFELLGNETRLAILLSLWEAYTPISEDNAVPFSELRERVGVRDSGQFNYHLGKLVDRYVEETEDGYELSNAGLNIVRSVIAGTGLGEETLAPTEVEVPCYLCGAPTEISYDDGLVYQACTECAGRVGEEFPANLPRGLIAGRPFNPAGLAQRTAEEVFAASHVNSVVTLSSFVRGVCPTCSGAIDTSLQVCEDHEVGDTGVCPDCGTRDEARVRWVCSVCKDWAEYQIGAMTHNLPVVDAFYYEQGLGRLEDVSNPESCIRTIERDRKREFWVESYDPIRIHIKVPGTDANLHLRLDKELDVIDVTQEDRETD